MKLSTVLARWRHVEAKDRDRTIFASSDLQVAQLPLSLPQDEWQHICVSWTLRDGVWKAYQGGKLKGRGEGLAAWHPIKPGGVLILGQEQVRHTPGPVIEIMADVGTLSVQGGQLLLSEGHGSFAT